jgi:hypothetical protein
MPTDVQKKDIAAGRLKIRSFLGFRDGAKGTHSSRTIMLTELSLLLHATPPNFSKGQYLQSIINENVLNKRTQSNRERSAQRLSELYGLDLRIPVFRALRFFWDLEKDGRPLLTFLCAYARDPLLRHSATPVLEADQGALVSSADIEAALSMSVSERFNQSILNKIARNAASSWTQSGYLVGKAKKLRSSPVMTPVNTTYALFLGYLEGFRAQRLLETIWVRLLDHDLGAIKAMAEVAYRRGWMDFKNLGGVVDIRFANLLTREEQELLHEQDRTVTP